MKLNLPKLHCNTFEIVFCSSVLENGFEMVSQCLMKLGTLLGSFLLAQKFIRQRLTRNKIMGAKLCPLADPQMIKNNAGKNTNTTVRHYRKKFSFPKSVQLGN